MGNPYTKQVNSESSKKRFERTVLRESKRQLVFKSPEPVHDLTSQAVEALLDLASLTLRLETPDINVKKTDVHDRCLEKITQLQNENRNAMEEISRLQTENRTLKEEMKLLQFSDKFVDCEKKDETTTFLTGLPNHATFLWLAGFLGNYLLKCKCLSPGSVLLLILMKLRLNLQNNDLALRFNVSVTLVSILLNEGLPTVASKLCFLVQWPSKENVIRNLPSVFRG